MDNNVVRVGLVAAAVVIIAVIIGIQLILPGPNTGGPRAIATPSAHRHAGRADADALRPTGLLEGPFVLCGRGGDRGQGPDHRHHRAPPAGMAKPGGADILKQREVPTRRTEPR